MNGRIFLICAALFGFAVTARCAPITYKEIAMLLRNGETPRSILQETAGRKLLRPLTAQEEADLVSLGGTAAMVQALRAPAMVVSPATASAYQAELNEQKRRTFQEQKNAELQAARSAPTSLPPDAAPAPDTGPPDKPMDLKFVSMDGTPVDLANMRGKVVLVDFWATWCGPCMMEVPEVVAAYNKYHDKGFEVIGISLDKSREAVLKTTAANGMVWPQYFDGNGWKNGIAVSCGIHSIPAMWLVNKQGIVATRQARGNLDALIGKLLE